MLLDPSLSDAHVAYALGRRVGGAVTRNRLRRQLRALLHEAGPRLRPGWYLIGASPGATELGSSDLHRHLERLLTRLEAAA
jgi:ribonuclease P protein component